MNQKTITLDQFLSALLRGRSYTEACIGDLAGAVATVTLPVANWSGRAQTVSHPFLQADGRYCYFICADAGCLIEYADAGAKADNVTTSGQVVFHCEIMPENDLTVYILRLEVVKK